MQHEAAPLFSMLTQDCQGILMAGSMISLVLVLATLVVGYWLGYCRQHSDLVELRELRKTEGMQAKQIALQNRQLLKKAGAIRNLQEECWEWNSKYEDGRCDAELLASLRDEITLLDAGMKSRQEEINKLKGENDAFEISINEQIHLTNVLELEIDHLKSEIKRFNLTAFKRLKARAKLETKTEKENINRRYAKHKENLKSKAA